MLNVQEKCWGFFDSIRRGGFPRDVSFNQYLHFSLLLVVASKSLKGWNFDTFWMVFRMMSYAHDSMNSYLSNRHDRHSNVASNYAELTQK